MGAYLELIRQQKQNQQQESELRLNMMQAAESDPDSLARAKKSADMLGLPLQAVQERLPEVEKEAFVEGFGYRDLIKNAPKTAEWLAADPLHAGVAKDDIENLSLLESVMARVEAGGRSLAAGPLRLNASLWGLPRAGADLVSTLLTGPLANVGVLPEDVGAKASAFFAQKQAGAETATNIVRGDMSKFGQREQAFYGGIESAGQTLVALPAAIVTGNPSVLLGTLSASTGGESYGKARDQGIGTGEALTYAASQAAVEYATEKLPVGTLLRDLGLKRSFGRVLFNQLITEMPQEQAATVLQDLNDWATLNPEKPFSEYIAARPEAAIQTAIATAVGTGLQTSVASAVDMAVNGPRHKHAEQVFKAIGDTATNSTLRARLPEKFKELAERYAGAQNAFIDAAQFNQYFQAQGIDPAAVARELGVPNYREAVAAGTDIVIPMGEFAAKLAPTDHLQGLMPDLKLSQGELSAREFEAQQGEMEAQQEEVAQQADPEAESPSRQQIFDDILGQLVGRFERSTAEAYATQYTAGISTLAERMGMDPLELHQRYGLSITSPLPEVLTKRPDLDTVIDPMIDAIRAGNMPTDTEVNGPSLIEFLRERGGVQDEGGELVSRDAKQQVRGLVRDSGMSLDAAREAAAEAGYISEDSTVSDFIDLLDSELRGDPVYSGRNRNDSLAEQQNALRELSNWMDQQGIDLNSTDNAAIKKLMYPESEGREFEQQMPAMLDGYSIQEGAKGQAKGKFRVINENGDEVGNWKDTPDEAYQDAMRQQGVRDQFLKNQESQQAAYNSVKEKALSGQEITTDDLKSIGLKPDSRFDFISPRIQRLFGISNRQVRDAMGDAIRSGQGQYGGVVEVANAAKAIKNAADYVSQQRQYNQSADVTQTPEFKAWFGSSKVVDAEGKPLVVYHGTNAEFDVFQKPEENRMSMRSVVGFWFTSSKEDASGYGSDLKQVYLSIKKPRRITRRKLDEMAVSYRPDEMMKKLKAGGHDGLIIEAIKPEPVFDEPGMPEQYVAFYPEQIKSAIGNRGTFDASNPNILFQGIDEYGMSHRPPGPDNGAPLDDLTGGGTIYPDDIYSAKADQYYGHFGGGDAMDKTTIRMIKSYRGNPDAPVKIYRAVPADIEDADINPGDWVTINKQYAEYHGESQFENGYKILEKMVKAKEIFTNGDSIHEYGYWPGRSYEQRQQDGARGYIRIGDNQRMSIALLEKANLSTFLHETGHMWLEVLGDLASQESAPQQIKDDYRTLLDWFGVESREQIQVEHHEKFARANEAYLMEGKAPSSALRAVFQRFKAWLTMIYRSLGRLDVQLTDEVRAVFDRIYASDEEIEAARAEAGMQALFSSPDQMGLTDAEFKAYRNSVTDASVIAQDKLRTELMREYQREHQKWFKERRAAVREEVEAEVNQNPVYVAFDALAAGKLSNDTPIKLAKHDLIRRYGAEYLKRLPRGFQRLYSAEGGIDTDMAAEILGFDSGDALVQALVNMRPRKQLIEAETDARMREQYGDMMLDGTIAERAEFALHNDKRADILMAELKALRRKQRDVAPFVQAERQKARDARAAARSSADSIPSHEVFRNTARGLVSQQALRDLQPQKYLLAERRASRRAFEAMAKGEVTVAANEKQKELLNHYLYLESTKAREQADKIAEYMGKFERKTIREKLGKAGADYLEQIDNILGRYEFRRMPLRTMDRRASLIAWAQQQEAAGMTVNIPDYLMDEARQVNYRAVTIDELQAVYDTVRNIEHLAGLKNKLLRKRDAVDFDEAKQELIGSLLANLNNTGELDKLNKKADTLADKGAGLWKRFDASMMKTEQLIEWMDGGNINGPWARYVFDLADDAQTREYDLHRDVTQKIVALHESMPAEWRASLQDKIQAIGLDGVKTRYDLLSIAFNVGNASNYDKLLRGRHWDDTDVQNALGQLTAEDKQFVQGMWDIVETLWPQMAELEKRVTGVTPVKIDAAPQVAAFEGMRGGYFPVVYDPRSSAFGAKQAEATQSVQDFMATGYGRATTDKGATRERTDAAAPLMLDYEQILTSHLAKVIKDITHREAIISLNKILQDNEIKAAMIATLGEDRYQLFNVWEQRLISDRSDTMHQGLGFWGDIMRGLRTNTAIVTMGWKISTMLSQFAGFGPSADLVKPRYLAKGLIAAVQHPVASLAFVVERSGEMRNRTNTLERDMKDALLKIRGEQSRLASIQRTAFYLTAMADRMVTIPTWLGAYQQALAENATEEDAIRAGDRAVRLSQGAGGAKDLASVQANNELMKLVTMYYTPFSVLYSRLRDVGHNTNGIRDLPHAAARVIALALLPAVLGELLAGRGPDDDEDETWWAVRKMLMYPLATAPMLRDLAAWQIEPILAEASGGQLRYAPGYQFSPVIKAIEKIVRLPEKSYDAMTGERPWDEVAWDIFESAGYVWGLPTAQPRITGEYVVDLFTGGVDPETAGEAMNGVLFRQPRQ